MVAWPSGCSSPAGSPTSFRLTPIRRSVASRSRSPARSTASIASRSSSGLPVLVIGAGTAGLLLASLSRLAGLAVVVVEPDEGRRKAAVAMAGAIAIDPASPDWREQALQATGGAGYDFVIEAAGSADGLETAVALSARHGRILLYGVARPTDRASVPPYDIYAKELTIIGTALNPFTHLRAVEMLSAIRFDALDRRSTRLPTMPQPSPASGIGPRSRRSSRPTIRPLADGRRPRPWPQPEGE